MLEAAKWIGTVAGIGGAVLIAFNLNVNQYVYGLFFVSSVLWMVIAGIQGETSLLLLQLTYTAINVIGFVRYAGSRGTCGPEP